MLSNARLRIALAFAGAVSLAVFATACGSETSDEDAKSNTQNGTSSAGGTSSDECPDKHRATVADSDGNQVTIDLCQTPTTYSGTAKKWEPIMSDMTSSSLPLNVNTRDDEAGDGSRDCYMDTSSNKCLPKAGDQLKLVCTATHPNDPSDKYYAVLMEDKLFNPTTLTSAGGGGQSSKTSSADHFTNAGDTPVGYLPIDLVTVKKSVPECSSQILHDQEARRQAAMEQQLPISK